MPLAEIVVSTLLAAAAPAPSGADAGAARAVATTTAPIALSVARETAAPVTRARASRIARRFIERRSGQPARVTGAEREDDFGARWEIEVTRRDGVELDVYVSARGTVVRVVRTPAGG